jgi:hypothetical protein
MTTLLVAALLFGLVGVTPATSAPSNDPPDSPRINFLAGSPDQFAAWQPFHVRHGWTPEKGAGPGDLHFYLFVDGEQIAPDLIGCLDGESPPCRTHVFEFPEGLEPGEHEFIATWMAPCEVWPQYSNCVKADAQMTHPDFVIQEMIEFLDVPYLGSWITHDGNSFNYLDIHPDGGFDVLDPEAVICGANIDEGGSYPAKVTGEGTFDGGTSTFQTTGDVFCPPTEEPVLEDFEGSFVYDADTDTLVAEDGLIWERHEGKEAIQETAPCDMSWYEIDPEKPAVTGDCDGLNIRDSSGHHLLVLTGYLPPVAFEEWEAAGSPGAFNTACLASYLFNRAEGFNELVFIDSTRVFGGDGSFREVCTVLEDDQG